MQLLAKFLGLPEQFPNRGSNPEGTVEKGMIHVAPPSPAKMLKKIKKTKSKKIKKKSKCLSIPGPKNLKKTCKRFAAIGAFRL